MKAILTQIGYRKMAQASGSSGAVAISHIALGDGAGQFYTADPNQTSLRGEKVRKQIDKRQFHGENSWRVLSEFPPETPAMIVREIGYFDQDGDLIVLQTRTEKDAPETGRITYLNNQFLTLSGNDEVVVVNAPDDEVFDLSVSVSAALANLQRVQLEQADEIAALKARLQAFEQ